MVEDAAELLRTAGHRVTSARLLVWQVVNEAGAHLTAEAVASRVAEQDPSVNLASVYRSLTLYEELGMIRQTHLGSDRVGYWEVRHPDEHFHLVCRACGTIDHHRGTLVRQIREHLAGGHGFDAERVDLTVTGLCARCAGIDPDVDLPEL